MKQSVIKWCVFQEVHQILERLCMRFVIDRREGDDDLYLCIGAKWNGRLQDHNAEGTAQSPLVRTRVRHCNIGEKNHIAAELFNVLLHCLNIVFRDTTVAQEQLTSEAHRLTPITRRSMQ